MKDINCKPCVLTIYDLPEFKIPYHQSPCNITDSKSLISINESSAFSDVKEMKKSILIRKIKTLIVDLICSSAEQIEVNLSEYLSSRLNYEYAYLSVLFSKDQGITIERFMIEQKIDRIKDFLLSDKLTITRIALNMNYSSVGHLSNQFKKVTGVSPSQFKKHHHFV